MRAPRSVQSCTALAIVFRSAADFGDRLRLTVSLRRVELERTFLRAHSPELPVVETKEELVRVDASDESMLTLLERNPGSVAARLMVFRKL